MRVFITGWLNSQYLPGIKRYAGRRGHIFPACRHTYARVFQCRLLSRFQVFRHLGKALSSGTIASNRIYDYVLPTN